MKIVIDDTNEFFNFFKSKEENKFYDVIYNGNVNDLYYKLLEIYNIKATILNCRTIIITSFRIDNIRVDELKDVNKNKLLAHSDTELSLYNAYLQKCKNSIINENNKSNYNENVLDIIEKYKPSTLKGSLDNENVELFKEHLKQNAQELYSLDYSKCHCSILMQMEYIPVINLFDDFVDYDPEEEIKPYSLYLIENHFRSNVWLSYGKNITDKENIVSVYWFFGIEFLSSLYLPSYFPSFFLLNGK